MSSCFFRYCLFGFLTPLSTTGLYRGRATRQSVWQFYVLPHMRQSWETMTSVSAGRIILTSTQPVGSGNRTRYLLTRSRALYRLSYRAPSFATIAGLSDRCRWILATELFNSFKMGLLRSVPYWAEFNLREVLKKWDGCYSILVAFLGKKKKY